MNSGLIAARYAKALYEFAKQRNSEEGVYADAKKVNESFFQHKKLRKVLDNPVMQSIEKRKIILLAAGENLSEAFVLFVDLLLKNNREMYLHTIVLKVIDLYRQQNNIHYGKLVTATKVNKAIEKKMLNMVQQETGGTVQIETIINPQLIGGFTFEVDFKRWDASISGQLNRIRREYIAKNRNIV